METTQTTQTKKPLYVPKKRGLGVADWIIDLGPEGGDMGGYKVFEGTPEEIVKCEESYTGKYLINKIL